VVEPPEQAARGSRTTAVSAAAVRDLLVTLFIDGVVEQVG
jgi:hypothetical protein